MCRRTVNSLLEPVYPGPQMKHYMQEGMMPAEVIAGGSYEESWLLSQWTSSGCHSVSQLTNKMLSRVQLVRQILPTMFKDPGFDTVCSKMNVINAGGGRCIWELTVREEYQNRSGTLHGGSTTTLDDVASTAALMSPCSVVQVDSTIWTSWTVLMLTMWMWNCAVGLKVVTAVDNMLGHYRLSMFR